MDFSTLVGSLGVALLLAAFLLNLFKMLSQDSKVYTIMNFVGAGFSCYASYLIQFWPFVILEGVWCLVALVAFVRLWLSVGK